MGAFGYSLFGFLAAIAILVTVHEYGHFWVARKLGVKVLRFSIGFGKSIFSWKRKDDPAEYSIGIIPLGGYVKMLDQREGDVAEEELHQAFNNKSLAVRSAVVAAGPIANFIFAIFAIWLVFVFGSDDIGPVVGEVTEQSIAEKAGFKKGDVLQHVDGKPVQSWSEHQFYMLHQAMKGNRISVNVSNVEFGDRELTLDFAEIDQGEISSQPITSQIGIWPQPPAAFINRIVEDSPAQKSGLQDGDLVELINGEAVSDWFDMAQKISSQPGAELILAIQRNNQPMEITLTSNVIEVEGQKYGQIGVYPPKFESIKLRYGPLQSIWASVDYNWRMTIITLRSLGRMVTAQMSSENLSGPITIARLAGQTAESGYSDFLKFLAIISVSLGLLNLLPIPVLDGGHLMYFLFEAITGKEPSEKVMIWGAAIRYCHDFDAHGSGFL